MPGGKICSVTICRSNSKKVKERGENTMFFSFPKDPKVRKEWIKRCFRKDQFSPEYKRICSRHFTPEDYEDKLKASLMGIKPRKLKSTAIPSLYIDPSTLGQTEEEKIILEPDIGDEIETFSETEVQFNEKLEVQLRSEGEDQFNTNFMQRLQEENELLRKENEQYKENCVLLTNRIAQLEQQLKNSKYSFEANIKVLFGDFLSPNQLDIALNKFKKHTSEKE